MGQMAAGMMGFMPQAPGMMQDHAAPDASSERSHGHGALVRAGSARPGYGPCCHRPLVGIHRLRAPGRQMTERDLDWQLVQRAQLEDKHAFELLVSKYQRRLSRLLSRFIRDAGEVEDVAQEAIIKSYRALPSFRGDSAFYTWLYRIGINTAKNYLAAMGRRTPTATGVDSEEAEAFDDADQLRDVNTPENVMMSKQIAANVSETMERLPEELRTAVTLREIEGLSYGKIATIMSCPIGTVRSRIFRAREAIAERLRPLLDIRDGRRW